MDDIDEDGDGYISTYEWITRLHDVMHLNFEQTSDQVHCQTSTTHVEPKACLSYTYWHIKFSSSQTCSKDGRRADYCYMSPYQELCSLVRQRPLSCNLGKMT